MARKQQQPTKTINKVCAESKAPVRLVCGMAAAAAIQMMDSNKS